MEGEGEREGGGRKEGIWRWRERLTLAFLSLQSLWHIVGSIIHLGNLEYEAGSEGHARFKNPKLIKTIAKVTYIAH